MNPSQQISKARILVTVIAIILLGVIAILYKGIGKSQPYSFGDEKIPGSSEMKLSETAPFLQGEEGSPMEPLSEKPLSYGDVVTLYGEKRIQLDKDCHATPTAASFTVGTIIVLDNRSESVKAVKFIDDTYAIPPFHIKIFELNRPGIFPIDCGTSKNVSVVRVN